MHMASIVLNIAADKADEFERGFKEFELPTHHDLYGRGLLVMSFLARVRSCSAATPSSASAQNRRGGDRSASSSSVAHPGAAAPRRLTC